MNRGLHYQTVPRHVEAIEHTGQESLRQMADWVIDLRLSGLIEPRIAFTMVLDNGEQVGRLHIGPGADALITHGGHLVYHPGSRGGPGTLEVVDEDRFFREFQPFR